VEEAAVFQSDTHLPHVLPPDAYHDPAQFAAEIERLHWPAWHCVGTTAAFPAGESPRSLDLLGVPLAIRRRADTVVVALDDSAPARRQRLRSISRPVGLRIGRVGQLVFVSLAPHGPTLAEQLGPERTFLEDLFGAHWAPCLGSLRELPCNWKLLVENVLENYHLEEVHSATFKHYPPPEACAHEMHPGGSSYVEVLPPAHSHLRDDGGRLARLLGVTPEPAYRHVVTYPNFTAGRMGLFNWAHCVLPVAPGRAVNAYWFFQLAATRRGPVAAIAAAGLRRWGRRFFGTLLDEDAAVLPGVQLGMESAARPTGGLVSAREERIFHFQRHVLERTGAVPAAEGMALTG
jgi:choline monooxygenase